MLMFPRLQTAPWWVWSLIMGVYFGTFTTLLSHWIDPGSDDSTRHLIIKGVVGGVFFGLFWGWFSRKANAEALANTGLDDPAAQRAASRIAIGGPIPADPELRRAAERLATYRLSELERQRVANLVFLGAAIVLCIAGAVLSSLWWIAFAVLFAAGLVNALLMPARMERRIDELMFPEEQFDDDHSSA